LGKVNVKHGQVIQKGDLIGLTGNTGRSNGPHLHYEIRFMQQALNPFWFVKWTMGNFEQIFTKEKRVPWTPLLAQITSCLEESTKEPILDTNSSEE